MADDGRLGVGVIILAKNITLVVKDTYLKDPTIMFWSEWHARPRASSIPP